MPVISGDVSLPSDGISLGKLWEVLATLDGFTELLRSSAPLSDFVYIESNYINFLVYKTYQRNNLNIGEQERLDALYSKLLADRGGPDGYRQKLIQHYQNFDLASGPETASLLIDQTCEVIRKSRGFPQSKSL